MEIIYDKKLLALALERKVDPKYAHETSFRDKGFDYDYEEQIFPSARFHFLKYDRAYKDNRAFAEAFVRDLHNKNRELIAEINKVTKTPPEQGSIQEEPEEEAEIGIAAAPTEEPETYPPPPPVPVMPKKIIILNPQEEPAQTETEVETEMETQPAATGTAQTESPQEAGTPPQTTGTPQIPSMSFSTGFGGGGAPPRKKGGMEGGTGQGTAATNKIDRLNKPPSMKKEKKRWFGRLRPKESSNFLNLLDNPLVDKLGGWLYRNAIKPLAQWLGRNVLQPLARLAAQTASRVLLPFAQRLALGALQGLLSVLGGLSGISLGGVAAGLTLFAASALIWLTAIAILIFFIAALWTGFGEFKGFNPSYSRSLTYTLPLRAFVGKDPISPHDIKPQIIESWPNAKLIDNGTDNWQKIIDAAVANNWNPALLLTLWIEASGAQGMVDTEGNPMYSDPLGCEPKPQTPNYDINTSLDCFFNKFGNYPKKVGSDIYFGDFIKTWVSKFDPESQNPNLFDDIERWYTLMIPEGEVGAIGPATSDQNETSGISGCPTKGIINTPYGINIPNYNSGEANLGCGNQTACHNGIDIAAKHDDPVRAIMDGIAKRSVLTIDENNPGDNNKDPKGNWVEIREGKDTGSRIRIIVTYEHLSRYENIFLPDEATVNKGDIVGYVGHSGKADGDHLHFRVHSGRDDGWVEAVLNPFNLLGTSANINSDVLRNAEGGFNNVLNQNDYAQITPSDPDNWGICNTSP